MGSIGSKTWDCCAKWIDGKPRSLEEIMNGARSHGSKGADAVTRRRGEGRLNRSIDQSRENAAGTRLEVRAREARLRRGLLGAEELPSILFLINLDMAAARSETGLSQSFPGLLKCLQMLI
jgi:hypothetical protein